jgi:hypothetical protein
MSRAEFEKWAFAQYGDAVSLSHDGLLHAEPFVQTLFIGWQAAKEQCAPSKTMQQYANNFTVAGFSAPTTRSLI